MLKINCMQKCILDFFFATGVWFNNSATEGFVHTGTKQVCEHVDNERRG